MNDISELRKNYKKASGQDWFSVIILQGVDPRKLADIKKIPNLKLIEKTLSFNIRASIFTKSQEEADKLLEDYGESVKDTEEFTVEDWKAKIGKEGRVHGLKFLEENFGAKGKMYPAIIKKMERSYDITKKPEDILPGLQFPNESRQQQDQQVRPNPSPRSKQSWNGTEIQI